jgi:hypothetical protein
MTFTDWQQRVVDEKHELAKKLENLIDFMKSDKMNQISTSEAIRLQKQALVMRQYVSLLSERIENFIEEKT